MSVRESPMVRIHSQQPCAGGGSLCGLARMGARPFVFFEGWDSMIVSYLRFFLIPEVIGVPGCSDGPIATLFAKYAKDGAPDP